MNRLTNLAAATLSTVALLGAPPAAAVLATLTTTTVAYADDGDGGPDVDGDWNFQNEIGGGTATPELPSGALVALSLLPVGALVYLRRSRRRSARTAS